jgi:hypothetical protein
MRFRFQMLVQRFNTFQQYWGRTMREIENGTYRRDVVRAAQRIGEKEALTILGKRRAEKYARLAARQQGAPKKEEPVATPVVEEVDETPTPARAVAAPKIPPAPLLPFVSRGHAQAAKAAEAAAEPRPDPKPQPPPRESDPDAARRRVAALAAEMRNRPSAGGFEASEPGGVSSPPARSRFSNDAATGPMDLELDLSSQPPPPPVRVPAPRRASSGRIKAVRPPDPPPDARTVPPAAGSQPGARRKSSANLRAVKPPSPTGAAASAAQPPPVPSPRVPAPPPARPVPPPAPSRTAAEDVHLSDQRVREIYTKYVETKRTSNESTAGITYDKLAESLRAQANKLRATHPNRRVDYEVVVKDGKTLLKPVLK